jgi:hypothetical protein
VSCTLFLDGRNYLLSNALILLNTSTEPVHWDILFVSTIMSSLDFYWTLAVRYDKSITLSLDSYDCNMTSFW